jgi:hypothetical protein
MEAMDDILVGERERRSMRMRRRGRISLKFRRSRGR